MNNRKIELLLEAKYNEYTTLKDTGAILSAVIRLSEIYNCIKFCVKSQNLKTRWENRISKIVIDEDMVKSINQSIVQGAERIHRIISVGDKFNDDEVLLVLTLRVQIELVQDFLRFREIKPCETNLRMLDGRIRDVGRLSHNHKAYNSALGQIRKNWGIPLKNIWLCSEMLQS